MRRRIRAVGIEGKLTSLPQWAQEQIVGLIEVIARVTKERDDARAENAILWQRPRTDLARQISLTALEVRRLRDAPHAGLWWLALSNQLALMEAAQAQAGEDKG